MTFIKGDSSKTLVAYAEQHPQSCDMFSVDGSHEYSAVKTDILNAIKATRPGGTIILDDMANKGTGTENTRKAFDDVVAMGVLENVECTSEDVFVSRTDRFDTANQRTLLDFTWCTAQVPPSPEETASLIHDLDQSAHSTHSIESPTEQSTEGAPLPAKQRLVAPPEGTQMALDQINEIIDSIPAGGNVLVYGLGNDSPFWHGITTGRVAFIEGHQGWMDDTTKKFPQLEAYLVEYSTTCVGSWDKLHLHPNAWPALDLRTQLPQSIADEQWHVVIIDSPLGYQGSGPGRYQPIITTQLMRRAGVKVDVFVDDFDRKVEDVFSREVFDLKPIKVIDRPARPIGPTEPVAVPFNQQGHFVFEAQGLH